MFGFSEGRLDISENRVVDQIEYVIRYGWSENLGRRNYRFSADNDTT